MRQSIPTGQKMDLGNLQNYWEVIDEEFRRLERLPLLATNRLLSARSFDESQPAGPRTYIEVTRYLGAARDNHEALIALFQHHGATLWAPWSLLRPTFEASFRAAWILDPEDGRDRRARGLRCEILDTYEQRKHRAAFKNIREAQDMIQQTEEAVEKGSLATFREEAATLQRSFEKLRQQINVTAELQNLSFTKGQAELGAMLEAVWRQLSGFEHGLGWALLSGSDRTIQANIPGGASVHMVINDEAFINAAKSAYFLLITACRLLARRHLEP